MNDELWDVTDAAAAWVRLDEVHRRCVDGSMAGPWVPRIAQLGARLAEFAGAR